MFNYILKCLIVLDLVLFFIVMSGFWIYEGCFLDE